MEKRPKPKVGTIVLIRDDNSSSLNWRMSQVKSVSPRRHGVIHNALVQTLMKKTLNGH